MANEYVPTLFDYLSIIRRRAPYVAGIFAFVLFIAIIFAITAKPVYQATGTIIGESQQVSDNIDVIKGQLDDQVNVIIQRMMTRENLLTIAHKYKLFPGKIDALTTSEIANIMRKRIVIEKGGDDFAISTNKYQTPNAISFTLSFEDENPQVALDATNDLIALFLNLSVKLRTEGAAQTTEFLDSQSKRLKANLDQLEQKIAAYKRQHSNALPELLTMRMSMLDRAQNDMLLIDRDITSTQDDIRSSQVELDAANQGVLGGSGQPQTLPALKAEYARLLAQYNESYPDVREVKRKIEVLESRGPASGVAATQLPASPAAYRLQARIASDNARLSSLAKQKEALQRKIAGYQAEMEQTPNVEQGLADLLHDRDTAQKKYEEIRSHQMNAQIAQNLVSNDKGGYFSVLERPVLPDTPKSKRMKILALGFILAIASSMGGVIVLESINKRVQGVEELTHVLGHRPLVVIPYITIQEDRERNKYISAIREAVLSLKQKLWWVGELKQKLWWVGDLKRKLWG
jgi:succinoglycan biosynthesis transport protein ExoP